jgi:hypothetical protein
MDASKGVNGMYTQTWIYKRSRNLATPAATAGTGVLSATSSWSWNADSTLTSFFSGQKFFAVRTDGHMVPTYNVTPNIDRFIDGILTGANLLVNPVATTFLNLPNPGAGLAFAYEANAHYVKLYVIGALPQGSGAWRNASGDGNWTGNTAVNNNWAGAQPISATNTATFDNTVVNYNGGIVNLDKGGQTIGNLVLGNTGSGGYTIGRNGGTVTVASAPGGTTITLASPPPSSFVVGTAILGTWVTNISGTTVTLASPLTTNAGYTITANTPVNYGNALTFDNLAAVSAATTTVGLNTITVTNPAGFAVGQQIQGNLIPIGATITGITGTTLTLSAPASATGTPTVMAQLPGTITVNSGNHTIAAPVIVQTGLNVNVVNPTSVLTMTGGVTSGFNYSAGRDSINSITKLGGGSLELNDGAYAHRGNTTVDGGTLRGTGSIPNSPVTVNPTGTLGAGTAATPGTLTLGSGLTLTSGSNLAIRMNTNTLFDQIVVSGGNVALGNATFAPSISGTSLVPADRLFVINNTGAGTTTGAFNGIIQDGTITIGDYTAQVSYTGDAGTSSLTGGNDVVLYNFVSTPVPEPTTLLGLSALGLASLGGLRRLRNRNR